MPRRLRDAGAARREDAGKSERDCKKALSAANQDDVAQARQVLTVVVERARGGGGGEADHKGGGRCVFIGQGYGAVCRGGMLGKGLSLPPPPHQGAQP